MSEYQVIYRLEQNEAMLPIIFVSQKDAINYVREMGLVGCWLHKESQSGENWYRRAI